MKTYRGYTEREDAMGPLVVTVQVDRGRTRKLRHRARHSPAGFSWGYGGSGPADLARSILADHLQGRIPHPAIYQAFKAEVIAKLPQGRAWALSADQVEAWLAPYRSHEQFWDCAFCGQDTRDRRDGCTCGRRRG